MLVRRVVVLEVRGEEEVQAGGHGLIVLLQCWVVVIVAIVSCCSVARGMGGREEAAVTQVTLIGWTNGEGLKHHSLFRVQMCWKIFFCTFWYLLNISQVSKSFHCMTD